MKGTMQAVNEEHEQGAGNGAWSTVTPARIVPLIPGMRLLPLVVAGVAAIGLAAGTVKAQQQTSPPAANAVRDSMRGASVQQPDPSEEVTLPATPAWNFFFKSTPDTGLDFHSAVYDPATNIMIVFGGADAGLAYGFTNAVLLRTHTNGLGGSGDWSTLIANGVAGSPTARLEHTAVYDSAGNRMIVFGGCGVGDFVTGCTTVFNDVWALANANGQGGPPSWTQLTPSGSPPAPRFGCTAVYDAANNLLIVFGGIDLTPNHFSDVWVLSNANGLGGTPAWTQLSPTGGPPAGVFLSSAIYDPNNNIMTVFAGRSSISTADTNAVWTLSHANGLGGTPQWTNIVANGAPGSPSKREAHTATYDVANNRMTIFGGGNTIQAFPGFNDVWVLANANGLGSTPTWTHLKTTGVRPGVREGHTAVYDAANNLMIVFAGANIDAQFYITWVLSDANGL